MKLFNKALIFSLTVILATSCTKLVESPEPGTSSSSSSTGGSTGGNTGDPAVYIGLWKLTEKTQDGNSIFDSNETFTVKLDVAATATWTYTFFGVEAAPISDSYILNTSSTPATVTFTNAGTREIVEKTGSTIKWQYNDPDLANALVIETLVKQ